MATVGVHSLNIVSSVTFGTTKTFKHLTSQSSASWGTCAWYLQQPRKPRSLRKRAVHNDDAVNISFVRGLRSTTEFSFSRLPLRKTCASREEIPQENLEDTKFVPINDDDPRFGPPVVLLIGFQLEEAMKVRSLIYDMDGDFMQPKNLETFGANLKSIAGFLYSRSIFALVLLCTDEMARGTLGEAVSVIQPDLSEVKVANGLPRICFISGLTGEELMMLVRIFPEAGLKAAVFAAHVPLNTAKSMEELMMEIMEDHRRLRPQRKSSSGG